MSDYRVIVVDQLRSALALARALAGLAQLPDEQGPWRQARPGGTRTVRIELAS